MRTPTVPRFTALAVMAAALVALAAASCGSPRPSAFQDTPPPPVTAAVPDAGTDATDDGPLIAYDGPLDAACVPRTCQDMGWECGPNGDGCGGLLDCGVCPMPEYCGGGGYSKCGGDALLLGDGGPSCTPRTCKDLGHDCGVAGDGCGGELQCGTCKAPEYCGGGGLDVCGGDTGLLPDGGPACTPATCKDLGYECGPAADGCGGLLQCGTCTAPTVCGAGKPGVCGTTPACTGLCQQQVVCDGGAPNTITGRVVAGTPSQYGAPDPVPNVFVYVPNAPLKPFAPGVTCSACGAEISGNPLVSTTTGADGTFTLTNVPVGRQIPVVIQLGRWRRGVQFDLTTPCSTTDVGDIRMPRTQTDAEIPGSANIPLTAISTGNVDAIECVLLKMGVDQSEFTAASGSGRVHMYVGNGVDVGPNTPLEPALMDTNGSFMNYDQILLPCWGDDPTRPGSANVKTPLEEDHLVQYANGGGRFFATHYSYTWLYQTQPFDLTATWDVNHNFYGWTAATIDVANNPKGAIFAAWLGNVGALTAPTPPTVDIYQPRHDVDTVNPGAIDWVDTTDYADNTPFLLHYTFDMPWGQLDQCGRVIFSDFHVTLLNTPNDTDTGMTFPAECTPDPMTAQEKMLEYMIWDLASCPPGPLPPACTPRTCQDQIIGCGPAGDGCGNQIDCGTCPAPLVCGGGGELGQCGGRAPCTPQTCDDQGIACGPAGDGCGNQIQCGTCTAPQTCGGGGVPGQCGQGQTCTPTTCSALGYNCGPAGDGCGAKLDCGQCTPPEVCGGNGVPGVCGVAGGATR
jgi:hypothetical protein